MSDHLTSQQISELVAGAPGAAAEEHVRDCPACRSEVEHFNGTLASFRQSVRHWSEEREPEFAPLRLVSSDRRLAVQSWGWAVAVAACLIAGVELPRVINNRPAAPHQVAAQVTDAQLLARVDRELSEAVPPSLEPIALKNRTQQ